MLAFYLLHAGNIHSLGDINSGICKKYEISAKWPSRGEVSMSLVSMTFVLFICKIGMLKNSHNPLCITLDAKFWIFSFIKYLNFYRMSLLFLILLGVHWNTKLQSDQFDFLRLNSINLLANKTWEKNKLSKVFLQESF